MTKVPVTDISFDTQGHRGCRGLMPENTIPAMIRALELGVTTLEMDAVITADKKVILSHEPFFNHEISLTPDGDTISEAREKEHNIYRMAYSDVLKYDVGTKPHPRFPQQQKMKVSKPLLAEVIDSVEAYTRRIGGKPPYFNIETKSLPAGDDIYHPGPAEFVDLLLAVINAKGITDRVIIQSFDFRTLQYVREKYPSVKTAMLVEDDDRSTMDQLLNKLGFVPSIYSPHFSHITASLVDRCHQKKMRVIPWTVNDLATMGRLKKLGVDGIISDYPNLFKEIQ